MKSYTPAIPLKHDAAKNLLINWSTSQSFCLLVVQLFAIDFKWWSVQDKTSWGGQFLLAFRLVHAS